MASVDRFADLTDEDISKILDDRDSSNTKQVIHASNRILSEYCQVKGIDVESLTEKTDRELAEVLLKFFAELRKKDGSLYSRSSMVSIRFGLQWYFQKQGKCDIVNDVAFQAVNNMFKAVLVQIKKDWKGQTQHKQVITDADMMKLCESDALSTGNPSGLQNRVFFDIMYYTCRRGSENLRKMKKQDLVLQVDSQNRRFFYNRASYQTQNHRGDDMSDMDEVRGRIYEKPGDARCPVLAIEKYLAKLNPDLDCLWQRPKKKFEEIGIWYDNMALGHYTLGNLMKKISVEADLSQVYTNHCIRATCITVLDHKGFESRHIMQLSGHKSESSLKHYAQNVSENKKHDMCSVLGDSLCEKKSVPASNTPSESEPVDLLADDNFLQQLFDDIEEQEKENKALESENNFHYETSVNVQKQVKCLDFAAHLSPQIMNSTVHIHYHIGK